MKLKRFRLEVIIMVLMSVLLWCTALTGRAEDTDIICIPFSQEYIRQTLQPDVTMEKKRIIGIWQCQDFTSWRRMEYLHEQPTDENVDTELFSETEAISEAASAEEFGETDIIFVGDSRVVGMAGVGGFHYVGEVGVGYSWLTGDGISWLQQEMAAYPGAAVVFCFGINDLGNIDAYIAYYNSLLGQYPDKDLYFMSVNPVNETAELYSGYTVSNETVEAFNHSLMEHFPNQYIDVYSYLLANGFGTGDGIHYDGATYDSIQQYTLLMINMMRNFGF